MSTFTTTPKHKLQWQSPASELANRTFFLNIGSGYNLLIDDTNKLIIQPGRVGTEWTALSRNRFTF